MINIDPNLIDPTCVSSNLDPTLFPVGTAQHFDINYNIIPFLCDLLKATTDPEATGILVPPPSAFDITPFTDFTSLTGIGDPRVSLGETLIQSFIHFMPKIIVQSEVRQNGGTQVIDNYICTADGTPIKYSETVPILLSIDLTGKNPYQYGAITIPPITTSFEELMKPLFPEHVDEYVVNYISNKKSLHLNDFVNFINTYFKDYTRSVYSYNSCSRILVVLEKETTKIYLKYYPDVVNELAKALNLNEIKQPVGSANTASNFAMQLALTSVIPDYMALMANPSAAEQYYQTVIIQYKTTPDKEYTTILANTATRLDYFKSTFGEAKVNSISAC
jgi:hypothetical protein